MAKITNRAGWQILEDVNKIITNAKLIYKNEVPKNFETLKTQYKETMAKKQALANSIKAQEEANKVLYREELGRDQTLVELDKVVSPSKSKTNETSKTPVINSALYKNDPPIQHLEPRTLPVLKRAIKRHEEIVREVLKKIETLQTEHKTIEDNYKVSIDDLKKELVELIGQDYAPALRSLFEPVDTKQREMERASREMLFSKWDTMDRRSGGSRRKRKQTRQTRQRRQTKRR
jgi:hypothetical protein